MPQKYLHYFGNESNESLLEAYGIITKNQQQKDQLKYKQCPNCSDDKIERQMSEIQHLLSLRKQEKL